ncbi:hypothetical protein [Nocardioides solisilvae]|uniref:hypothetical protein n=1 Tax=Nocardioides solisilvae TaxID=1542435 RepID=UPI001951EFB2|nr:hypothetical protein [Nocardioides solisilvae]
MLKILIVVLLVALAIYAVTRLLEKRGRGNRPGPRPRQAPPRVMGPDDDPDFLRDLERKRRRQEDEPEAG